MAHPHVTIGVVTWNSAEHIEACLASVRAQSVASRLLVVDNASRDATLDLLGRLTRPEELIRRDRNTGFSAAHNLAIRKTETPYYLALNPDVVLRPDYVGTLVERLEADERIGSATGKLLLADSPDRIDSAGIAAVASQRHLDRGQGEVDRGQFERPELVFGASAAAALYRRRMLDDVAEDGRPFDEEFFAYREDVDLAWRAQWRGWGCLYEPLAVALHGRRVRPGLRRGLPPAINRASVRNRFLIRMKNQTAGQAIRWLLPTAARDLQVAGFCLLAEWSSLAAFADVGRLAGAMRRKRRAIMAGRRVGPAELDRWIREPGRPYHAGSALSPRAGAFE